MAKQVQLRRGTTAELSSVTGAIGEVIVDTTKDTLTVHDGYTVGGTPLLKEDLGNLGNNTIGLTKIATGTQGQILYYNASGQLVALNPGTSGYVLKTNGAGQNPSWAEGLPTQTGNSGKVLTTDGTSSSWGYSKVINFQRVTYATRTSLPNSSNYTYWSTPITKLVDSSNLFIELDLSMRGNYSDCLVHECQYAGSSWFQGTMPYDAGFGANSRPFHSTFYLTGITNTGSNTINFRWRTASGSTGDRPAELWNPNSSDDSRYTQEYSAIHIWEIA